MIKLAKHTQNFLAHLILYCDACFDY